MLSRQDNDRLTQTDAGTAMGDYFRRFWQPVLLSRELPGPDSAPRRVRVMGENLLAFRDSSGRVGLVEPRCPHRGADLYFGRNGECGLRCAFHGWKFDVDGKCLETPTLPRDSDFRHKVSIKAYPTSEFGEIIWAYMGPAERQPELPHLEFALLPATQRYVSKKLQECNWAQSVEGGIDTAHFSFLHMVIPQAAAEAETFMKGAAMGDQAVKNDRVRWVRDDPMPRFEVVQHGGGLLIGASRLADDDQLYWRITQFLVPNHSFAPAAFPGEIHYGQTWVPITDTSCWIFTYAWHPERQLTEAERQQMANGHGVHSQVDENFVPVRNRANDYLIDREAQRTHSYSGITGISEQDAAIQDSQGLIHDRTREILGPTDLAIMRFRRLMLEGAKALQDGVEPPEAARPEAYTVRSGGWVTHRDRKLADVMVERFGDPIGDANALYREPPRRRRGQSAGA
ncbi:MAG TPA: Rieske 2Fe-2S domain-containing protein [Vineibacter sp.]|nr:Rieske 2Fe-2S domain-containing protein [Vineibacter sp.]